MTSAQRSSTSMRSSWMGERLARLSLDRASHRIVFRAHVAGSSAGAITCRRRHRVVWLRSVICSPECFSVGTATALTAADADSHQPRFQLAGKHGWVPARMTRVRWRTILEGVQIWNASRLGPFKEVTEMQFRLKYLTPLLAAGAAAAAIAVAPSAAAAPAPVQQSCNGSSLETVCQSPGNVQLTASPPYVEYNAQYPFYGYYGRGYGGFHGGHRFSRRRSRRRWSPVAVNDLCGSGCVT